MKGPRPRVFRPRRFALLLGLVAVLAVAADLFLPAGLFPPREKRAVLVERGQSLGHVAAELHRVGLLRGTLGFQVLARLMDLDRHIKAGQYEFTLGTTVPELLRALAEGMSGLNLVTIPEGLTLLEVGALLSHHLGVPIAEFDSLGHDEAFCDSLGVPAKTLEGYLAPDTYELLPGTPPEVALRTMVGRQKEVLRRAVAGHDSLPLGLTSHEILILASIVESEAQKPQERPRIARVYLNRLKRGMKLQADPTVAYGMGMRPRSRLYLSYLRTVSPFNTYLYMGLPPGPICNPGEAAIRAAVNPSADGRSLYFVAKGDGGHLFSGSYEEHLANIRRAHEYQAAVAGTADSLRSLDSLAVKDSVAARTAAKPGAVRPGAAKAGTGSKAGPAAKPGAPAKPGAARRGAPAKSVRH